jgi:hypothetical protein
MIRFSQIERTRLAASPFGWASLSELFSPSDATLLAATYPRDHFKTVRGNDKEKGYLYEARSLIAMNATVPSHASDVSPAWRQLAADLLSPEYRAVMSRLTGLDLGRTTLEVNVFHYGPGCWLGPHLDLKDKLVTHVFYFNTDWDVHDGGCLAILRSASMADLITEVPPLVGNAVVLVRSEKSWHAVSRVRDGCRKSRRSMTVTFYPPGSTSSMWPANDATPLHCHEGPEPPALLWTRVRQRLASWMTRGGTGKKSA